MDRLHAMTVFVAVAENRSFAGAARALSMTAPAATRAVSGLEDHLGVRLFVRTTRQVRLTEAGERYLADCRRLLADLAEAEGSARGLHAEPRGMATISAPQLFGRNFVLPVVLDYLDAYPEAEARLLFLDRIVNLVEEGVDLAVRISHLPDSGLRAVRVGQVRRVIVAAPAYLERCGVPERPEDLPNHRLILPASEFGAPEWRLGADQSLRVAVRPRLRVTTNDAAIAAALAGWGVTRQMSYQVADAVADGALVRLLTDWEPDPLPVHIVHAQAGRVPAKVRLLVDRLVERLRAEPKIR